MAAEELSVLRSIRGAWAKTLAELDGHVDIGPLRLTFDSASDMVWTNYGVPIVDAAANELAAAIEAARPEFEKRKRRLRFEFFEALEPNFEGLCKAAGMSLHAKLPALCCTAVEAVVESSRVKIAPLDASSDDETLKAFCTVRSDGFDGFGGMTLDEQVADQRKWLSQGDTRAVLVHLDGQPAGVGSLIGQGPVRELVGVATAKAHRRQGVARAASEWLARDHLSRGGQAVWLSAADDLARRVYERIGFRFIGWQLNYIEGDAAT